MPLSTGQQQVALCNKRFRTVIAGRRFGKTHLAIRELAKAAREPKKNVWYISPTYRQSKQILWTKLKERLRQLRWIKTTNESELSITLVNGSVISLKGADKPDSLRGVGLDAVILDEFADISEQTWTEVLRPALADRQGTGLFIGTPKGRGNWSYQLFQRAVTEPDGEWASFQFTTVEGGNVTPEEIEQARKDLDERTFRQEFLATFETYSGAIYYNFDIKRNVRPFEFVLDARQELLVMVDFNVDPMSAVVAVRTGTGIHVIDEIIIYGSNTDELVQEIRNRYPENRITCFPDPAGSQRKSSAGGRTDITILQNAGFNMKFRRSHPAVKDRINSVNSLLLNSAGDVRLLIDPKCKRLIEGLTKQCYKEGTQIPDKNSGWDHENDALGYGVEYLFPITRHQEVEDEPQYFSVRTH